MERDFMIHYRILKNLPIYISKSFPILFSATFECDEDEFIVIMYNDNNPVCCCYIELEDSVIDCEGKIKVNIHIHKFEVRIKHRRKGFGKQMVEWISKRFPINKISLTYLDESALLFWESVGFCKESKDSSSMYKIIQK